MKIQLKISRWIFLWLLFVLQDADQSPSLQITDASVSDANLMFEFLLGGVELEVDNNIALLDREMASMRSGRAFLTRINDHIPRGLSSMVQMVTALNEQRRPLTQNQFDDLVLSMVYSAHQAWHQEEEEEKEAWSEVLLQLANVTVYELRGSFLFSNA